MNGWNNVGPLNLPADHGIHYPPTNQMPVCTKQNRTPLWERLTALPLCSFFNSKLPSAAGTRGSCAATAAAAAFYNVPCSVIFRFTCHRSRSTCRAQVWWALMNAWTKREGNAGQTSGEKPRRRIDERRPLPLSPSPGGFTLTLVNTCSPGTPAAIKTGRRRWRLKNTNNKVGLKRLCDSLHVNSHPVTSLLPKTHWVDPAVRSLGLFQELASGTKRQKWDRCREVRVSTWSCNQCNFFLRSWVTNLTQTELMMIFFFFFIQYFKIKSLTGWS